MFIESGKPIDGVLKPFRKGGESVGVQENIRLLYEYDIRGREASVLLYDLGQVTAKSAYARVPPTALQALFHSINAYGSDAYCDIAKMTKDEEGRLTVAPRELIPKEEQGHTRKQPNQYDIAGFSLVNPNQTFDLFEAMDAAGIPIFADERKETDPLVFLGGAAVINPFPYRIFADVFIIGQGEKAMRECADIVAKGKRNNTPRSAVLEEMSRIPGVYVPSSPSEHTIDFAEIRYNDPEYPPGSVMVEDGKASLVISRSCPFGCAYCRFSNTDRYQAKQWPQIVEHLQRLRDNGATEVSIVSGSASAWRHGDKTVNDIIMHIHELGMTPQFLSDRPGQVGFGERNHVILAPEASPRMRSAVLQKSITEEELTDTVQFALDKGVNNFTFFSIIGIPGETADDLGYFRSLAAATIAEAQQRGKDIPQIEFSVMPLMPSPHTNLETAQMIDWQGFMHKLDGLNASVKDLPTVKFITHLTETDYLLEALLNRGVEQEGRLAYNVYRDTKHLGMPYQHYLHMMIKHSADSRGMDEYLSERDREQLPWYKKIEPVRRRRFPRTPLLPSPQGNELGD